MRFFKVLLKVYPSPPEKTQELLFLTKTLSITNHLNTLHPVRRETVAILVVTNQGPFYDTTIQLSFIFFFFFVNFYWFCRHSILPIIIAHCLALFSWKKSAPEWPQTAATTINLHLWIFIILNLLRETSPVVNLLSCWVCFFSFENFARSD